VFGFNHRFDERLPFTRSRDRARRRQLLRQREAAIEQLPTQDQRPANVKGGLFLIPSHPQRNHEPRPTTGHAQPGRARISNDRRELVQGVHGSSAKPQYSSSRRFRLGQARRADDRIRTVTRKAGSQRPQPPVYGRSTMARVCGRGGVFTAIPGRTRVQFVLAGRLGPVHALGRTHVRLGATKRSRASARSQYRAVTLSARRVPAA